VKLFILNQKYAYWQINASLVLPIILGAFVLCVCFALFIFAKMNNSRIYLFNMYLLFCIKYILFLEVFTVFGCTQLIPLKRKQIPIDITISSLQKLSSRSSDFIDGEDNICHSKCLLPEAFPMINGIFMLIVRITYFALLADGIATIWMRG
jgi:hypothetical protein